MFNVGLDINAHEIGWIKLLINWEGVQGDRGVNGKLRVKYTMELTS